MLAGCAVSPLPQRAFVLDAGEAGPVLSSRRTAWMSISPGGGP